MILTPWNVAAALVAFVEDRGLPLVDVDGISRAVLVHGDGTWCFADERARRRPVEDFMYTFADGADVERFVCLWSDLAAIRAEDAREARRKPKQRRRAMSPAARLARDAAAVWRALSPVSSDAEVTAWLEARGIDAIELENSDAARVAPRALPLPRWASHKGRPWTNAHRLVLPAYAANGAIVGLVAASADGALSMPGVMTPACPANRLGRLVLARAPTALDMLRGPRDVRVCDGLLSFLRAASTSSGAVCDGAVGSWTAAHAARVPSGCRVARDAANDNRERMEAA